ncbi:MAG: glycoside hydrolase family 6 protein [Marmoricola sp.]
MRFKVFIIAVVIGVVSVSLTSSVASATSGNPLTGHWGVDTDPGNYVYPAYQQATGHDKTLLGKIALRPRMIQVGSWIAVSKVRARIAHLVANQQAGDHAKLTQFATFNLWPQGESAVGLPSGYTTTYRAWYQQFVAGIGTARAVVMLESDLPVAVGSNRSPAARESLTRWAAQLLAKHSNITVYIDGGDSDWLTPARSAAMLKAAGVGYARGFALGSTHYAQVGNDINYGAKVVSALASLGIRGRHLIIDTADNGRGFTWTQFQADHPGKLFDDAQPCTSTDTRACTALGIPPTTNVASLNWHLTATERSLALAHVDGYLWFGRPWLHNQAYPFELNKALAVAAASPY